MTCSKWFANWCHQNFPKPEKVTDIRSWFGLVNQVAYTFSQAEIMEPFRELLSGKKRVWSWDETLTDVFNKSKEAIVAQIREGVHNFSINRATCLATDWSKTGIGFTLSQKHCQCRGPANPGCGEGHWKLVYVGSRFLKDAETRYAPIEGCLCFGKVQNVCPRLPWFDNRYWPPTPPQHIKWQSSGDHTQPKTFSAKAENPQIFLQSCPYPWQIQLWTRLYIKVSSHWLVQSPHWRIFHKSLRILPGQTSTCSNLGRHKRCSSFGCRVCHPDWHYSQWLPH